MLIWWCCERIINDSARTLRRTSGESSWLVRGSLCLTLWACLSDGGNSFCQHKVIVLTAVAERYPESALLERNILPLINFISSSLCRASTAGRIHSIFGERERLNPSPFAQLHTGSGCWYCQMICLVVWPYRVCHSRFHQLRSHWWNSNCASCGSWH